LASAALHCEMCSMTTTLPMKCVSPRWFFSSHSTSASSSCSPT
jgi:hypothetical protein